MTGFSNSIVVATNNQGKIPEIADNLALDDCRFLTLREIGVFDAPPETGETYEENARIKVRAARAAMMAQSTVVSAFLADDSGLEVDALGGAPGLFSARYAGSGSTDADNVARLLDELRAVPKKEGRRARFVCSLVYLDEAGCELVAEGSCEGRIAFAPCGLGGFGYDPVFLPDAITDGRTMAELSPKEKNSISHRGNALRALREKLVAQYGPGKWQEKEGDGCL
ncbi:MAG: RdgB/HAM1 family non-canonical purine NTP pyrophosphatase [Coriobacteriia bacterium]|nr:RdgB/HAM1 family non-canonical purine NTP pyrophosphatase [Coriobacteriia bacterium]